MLFAILLLTLVQSCLGDSQLKIGTHAEPGKQISSAVSDFTKLKSGSEYVALDKDQSKKEDAVKFDKTETEKQSSKQEGGVYNEKDEKQSGHDIGKNSAGQSQAYDAGKNAYEKSSSGEAKKGYHRSGFVNNYHKDESGNNMSFYEDSRDEKSHLGHDNRDQYYGRTAEDAYKDGRYDSAQRGHNRVNNGEYGRGERYNDHHDSQGNFNSNAHDNARSNYLRDDAERYTDRNGNEIYYYREHHPRHHPHDFSYHQFYGEVRPLDYNRRYPQDFDYHNYPIRRYNLPSDLNRGDSYYPENRRYYRNSYDVDRSKENSDYENVYMKQYLPDSYSEEYIDVH